MAHFRWNVVSKFPIYTKNIISCDQRCFFIVVIITTVRINLRTKEVAKPPKDKVIWYWSRFVCYWETWCASQTEWQFIDTFPITWDTTQVTCWGSVRKQFHHFPFHWLDGHTCKGIGIPMMAFHANKKHMANMHANGPSNEHRMLKLTHKNGSR
jgi:hypothetical protein